MVDNAAKAAALATGTISREIPGLGFAAKTSNYANHTYEMEADALTAVGHDGFMTDAEAMAALLYELATRPGYLALVQKEFAGIKASFGDYQQALAKTYIVPSAPEPK